MDYGVPFPRQAIPYKQKGEKWGREVMDYVSNKTYFNFHEVRRDVVRMKKNYDLVNGIIYMSDIASVVNPGDVATLFLPDKVQHYPIINSKLNVLRGEEAARVFDWRAIVTNPNAISEMEEEKRQQFNQSVLQIVENGEVDDAQADAQLRDNQEFYDLNWQDWREKQCNELLKHYQKEQNFKQTFNKGFLDVCIASREFYEIGIVGGEPYLTKLNPLKLRFFRNGYSNHVEDADLIIYEDYWSIGKVLDVYYDELTSEQVKKLSDGIRDNSDSYTGAAGNVNEAAPFATGSGFIGEEGVIIDSQSEIGVFDELSDLPGGLDSNLLPYDVVGNVRVLRAWWRSKRLIYRVTGFDELTGEETIEFYPETYVPDKDKGEKAEKLWINEMWEGTKIGKDIYVNIRPCLVQHNSISNPSRCHASIVGTIYNINESNPYSLVDMMKPYNYLYDAVHAKLVDLIATNWGKLVELDLALKPKNWDVKKWMYFARANKVLVRDSFREGDKGAAMGKLAASLNNASKGYVDADWGQSIQNYIELLQWTRESMSDLVGINRQREGQTYSRETVGGIERSVLQSSYITDWLFMEHDDTKRRVLECFIDNAKAAIHGRSKKFQYTLSDGSRKIMEIDGDEFCLCDYGIVVDNANDTQKLAAQIDNLAQAALQNQYKLSLIAKLYSSASLGEKIKVIEKVEKDMARQQQEAAQQEQQLAQQKIQADMQAKQAEMQQKAELAQLDSDTRIKVAEINSKAEEMRLGIYEAQNNIELRNRELDIEDAKLQEEIRQFDLELRQDDKELNVKKEIEEKKIAAQKQSSNKKSSGK